MSEASDKIAALVQIFMDGLSTEIKDDIDAGVAAEIFVMMAERLYRQIGGSNLAAVRFYKAADRCAAE